MIQANVSSNLDKVLAEFTIVTNNLADKAAVRALNRAADQTKTEAKRQIAAVYNLKSSAAAEQIATSKAFAGRLVATVTVRGRAIPLVQFDARWKQGQPGGATVKVKRGGNRKNIRGAFIARMKSGHTGVFVRQGGARLPVRELYTIGLPRMFLAKVVQDAVRKVATESFEKNFRQQIQYLTTRGVPF